MHTREINIVKRTLDLNDLPKISDEQKARLAAIAEMQDGEIDYSDAPFLENASWVKSADLLPKNKKLITLRIDSDVVDYFKRGGKFYQSRINAVLRSYVEASKLHAK